MLLRSLLLRRATCLCIPAVSLDFMGSASLTQVSTSLTLLLPSLGYGPPDNITIKLSDPAQPICTAVNPTGFRDFEIGIGHVNCGNAQDTIEFYGNSNEDTGSVGRLQYNGYVYNTYTACQGTPQYTGSFPLSCTRDAGGNATCGLQNGATTLNLVGFIQS